MFGDHKHAGETAGACSTSTNNAAQHRVSIETPTGTGCKACKPRDAETNTGPLRIINSSASDVHGIDM